MMWGMLKAQPWAHRAIRFMYSYSVFNWRFHSVLDSGLDSYGINSFEMRTEILHNPEECSLTFPQTLMFLDERWYINAKHY